VTREGAGLTLPASEAEKVDPLDLKEAKKRENEKVVYTARFLPYESDASGKAGADATVIADRGFNEEQLWRARFGDKSELYQEGIVSRWDRSNPNILTLSFPDGVIREVKVTKRSFEKPGEDQFGLSEFCRVAEASQNVGASIPRLSAIRVLQRFKRTGPNMIEGLELVKYYPTTSLVPDPPAFQTLKTRVKMEKIK
jgi:hypothetical protein